MIELHKILLAISALAESEAGNPRHDLSPEKRLRTIQFLTNSALDYFTMESHKAAPLLSVYDNGEVIDVEFGGES